MANSRRVMANNLSVRFVADVLRSASGDDTIDLANTRLIDPTCTGVYAWRGDDHRHVFALNLKGLCPGTGHDDRKLIGSDQLHTRITACFKKTQEGTNSACGVVDDISYIRGKIAGAHNPSWLSVNDEYAFSTDQKTTTKAQRTPRS